jgi:hypothetical protein
LTTLGSVGKLVKKLQLEEDEEAQLAKTTMAMVITESSS